MINRNASTGYNKLPSCRVLLASYLPSFTFADQLCSIAGQVDVRVLLTISDDSPSPDRTLEMFADSCLKLFPEIEWLQGPRKGIPVANFLNLIAYANCNSDFFAFSDQDDIWMPNKLSAAIDELQESGASCYSSELMIWNEGHSFHSAQKSNRWREKREFYGVFFAEGAGCTFVLTRKAFMMLRERVKQLIASGVSHLLMSHDLFASVYLQALGFSWMHDKRSFIYYRQHSSNAWGAKVFSLKGLSARLDLLANGSYMHTWCFAFYSLSAHHKLVNSCSRFDLIDLIMQFAISPRVVQLFSAKYFGLLIFIFSNKVSLKAVIAIVRSRSIRYLTTTP